MDVEAFTRTALMVTFGFSIAGMVLIAIMLVIRREPSNSLLVMGALMVIAAVVSFATLYGLGAP